LKSGVSTYVVKLGADEFLGVIWPPAADGVAGAEGDAAAAPPGVNTDALELNENSAALGLKENDDLPVGVDPSLFRARLDDAC